MQESPQKQNADIKARGLPMPCPCVLTLAPTYPARFPPETFTPLLQVSHWGRSLPVDTYYPLSCFLTVLTGNI